MIQRSKKYNWKIWEDIEGVPQYSSLLYVLEIISTNWLAAIIMIYWSAILIWKKATSELLENIIDQRFTKM